MMDTQQTAIAAQFLTFKMGEETFAVEVTQVREVLELVPITKIPTAPPSMRGVINVRGSVVPVVNLRNKLEMEDAESTVDTCIVVLEIVLETESVVLGVLVDSVQEVIELLSDHIDPPPKMGTSLDTEFIKGIGREEECFIIILDTDRMFSGEELEVAQDAATEEEEADAESVSGT
jgi:purine-binding chemotaxis protein CheW